MELNTLFKDLSERVKNLLNEVGGDNEWNFLWVDGFLLCVNQDVINELDIKLFVKADYDTLKNRRENRGDYITIEGIYQCNVVYDVYAKIISLLRFLINNIYIFRILG